MWLILMFFMFRSSYDKIKNRNPLEAFIEPQITLADTLPDEPEASIPSLIVKYSKLYQVSEKTMNRVIKAESNYDCEAIGDGTKAKGIAQFHAKTFDWLSKKMGEKLNYHSCADQIKLLAWSIANGYGKHWTTY
jgi:soluble lytic murein transglycosylase-like protein